MTAVLAAPPTSPVRALDIAVPGGRLRQHADGLVELATSRPEHRPPHP